MGNHALNIPSLAHLSFEPLPKETTMPPTGKENVDAAIDNLTNTVLPAVKAYILDLRAQIDSTASDGLTGPQTQAVWDSLTNLAGAFGSVTENPTQPLKALPKVTMPGPLLGETPTSGAQANRVPGQSRPTP
jgi:hypothetical protein